MRTWNDIAVWQYILGFYLCISFYTVCTIFQYGQSNYFCKVLIIYRIMGETGSKHVISAMQADGMSIYVQHSKMYIQKVTS